MPEYVLNRNYALASTRGHVINFVKGQPTYVPPNVVNEAVAIGATRVDGEASDVLGPEATAKPEMTADERQQALFEVFKTMEARNQREDFTGAGNPTVKAVEKLSGLDVDAKELTVLWNQYRTRDEA